MVKTMSAQAAQVLYKEDNAPRRAPASNHRDEATLAVVERLKEEFGDYSDPMTYDWTWRETD